MNPFAASIASYTGSELLNTHHHPMLEFICVTGSFIAMAHYLSLTEIFRRFNSHILPAGARLIKEIKYVQLQVMFNWYIFIFKSRSQY